MKNLLLLCLSTGIWLSSDAQITLSQDHAPAAGAQWTQYISDEDGFDFELGPSGADQLWDYGSFAMTFTPEPLDFFSPSMLPGDFATAFPGTDLAVFSEEDDSNVAQYFTIESDGLYTAGIRQESDEGENELDYQPDLLFMPFDFTYEDTREGSGTLEVITEEGGVGVLLRSTTLTEMEGDGYGTLITPSGTFDDVLRIRNLSYKVDSVFLDQDGSGDYTFFSTEGPSDSSVTYFHVQNAQPIILASAEYDVSSDEFTSFSYILAQPVSLSEISLDQTFDVFPNPSNGLVRIDLGSAVQPRLEVLDINGRSVHQATVRSVSGTALVDLQVLDQGSYLLRLWDGDRFKTASIVIE